MTSDNQIFSDVYILTYFTLGRYTRISTYFIMGMNVPNSYGENNRKTNDALTSPIFGKLLTVNSIIGLLYLELFLITRQLAVVKV